MPRGYDRPLYILPFDHRESFETKLFGWEPPLGPVDWTEQDWVLHRLLAVCSLARTLPKDH